MNNLNQISNQIREGFKGILESIDIKIKEAFKTLKFPYYIEGTIIQVNLNNTYDVLIDGEITNNLKVIDNKIYKRGDIVKILIINSNYSEKYIHFKKP